MDHLTEKQIWSFLEADLAEHELEAMELHFEECDECFAHMTHLADMNEQVPDLFPLEQPSVGFADRVMAQIPAPDVTDNVVPFPNLRRNSSRLELLTRVATAAVVSGFMMLGTSHAQGIPMIGSFGEAVHATGNVVTDGTVQLTSTIDGWIAYMSQEISK